MSKKNKKFHQSGQSSIQQNHAPISLEHASEYSIIKWDLIRVLILNAVFLAAILTLYYTNLKTHYLEEYFAKLLRF